MTQQEYSQFMEDLEMRHLENMLAIAGLEPEKRQQIEQKILEARIKYKEECENWMKKMLKIIRRSVHQAGEAIPVGDRESYAKTL